MATKAETFGASQVITLAFQTHAYIFLALSNFKNKENAERFRYI
jgi:hypothetical protein